MAVNKYCNLYGENKIKDDYTKINYGFAAVEADVTGVLNSEIAREAAETQREVSEANRVLRYENTKHYGAYNPAMTYHRNNIVSQGGCSYMLIVDDSTGNAPPTYPTESNTWWAMVGKKGDKGDTGAVPNIQVGTITTLQPTDPATVTRRVGSPDTAPVFDFGIPKGVDGTGAGDMTKLVYDPTSSGSVKLADNLKGLTVPVSELNKLTPSTEQTVSLLWGMNLIRIPEVSTAPKFKFSGFSITNLLGKDGNCEDTSKANSWQCTDTLDSTNKVFGSYGIKGTITGTTGYAFSRQKQVLNLDNTKYYMVSAYLKNGNATAISVGIEGLSVSQVTDTTKFNRVCAKYTPAQIATLVAAQNVVIYISGSAGQYGYVDGIMVNEISAADYALSDAELLAKYPYVDSYAALTNPYFENRRYNLIRNGNCEEGIGYWKFVSGIGTISIENGKFKLVTTAAYTYWSQTVKVKPNTNYVLSGNWSGNGFFIILDSSETTMHDGTGAFNTGNNTEIMLVLHGGTTAGTTYFDSVMLVEGTTAPTEYKSCDLQRFVVEGQFTADDTVTIENGKVSGLLNWKHRTLYGKDFDWNFNGDAAGYKHIYAPFANGQQNNSWQVIKYDGSILRTINNVALFPNSSTLTTANLMISIPDTDSGWAETINPNTDEIKAFMNGWKAIVNTGGRYILWRSIVDNSYPVSAIKTNVATGATSSNQSVTAGTGTTFKVGDTICHFNTTGTYLRSFTVTSVSADSIGCSLTFASTTGDLFVKADNGTTDLSMLNWCKNNVAPGYEVYKLHYKLANPEPITDVNVHIEGEILDLVKGDNYVTVDSGIVLGEVANVGVSLPNYWINSADAAYPTALSLLRNKTEDFIQIFKNSLSDIQNWTINPNLAYGRVRAFIDQSRYDTSATYTVDYQILKTLHAQTFSSLSLSYPQSIINTLDGHSKALEQKQPRNSALDTYIDATIYEEVAVNQPYYGRPFNAWGLTAIALNFIIPITPKKCVPDYTIKISDIMYADSSYAYTAVPLSDITILGVRVSKSAFYISVGYTGSNTTIKNNLMSYGMRVGFEKIVLDCRKKV